MKHPRLLHLLAPAVAMLSAGCMQTVCGCIGLYHVVVHGTVTTAAGVPVQDAFVNVALFQQVCDDPLREIPVEDGQVTTDAAGRYEISVSSPAGGNACLRVTAVRGTGAQADSVWATGLSAPLMDQDDEPNRVRVDLVFP